MYRVRKQAITGKLILQNDEDGGEWNDERPDSFDRYLPVSETGLPFEIIGVTVLAELRERIAKYERRAEAQRKSRKAAAQQPATESEGATPAAPQSLAQE